MLDTINELKSIRRTRKTVNGMVWVITTGAVLFSLMTGAPLVSAHSHWSWVGWILPVLVDAALVLSLSADAVLSKHGLSGGRWPTAFRWITGLASLFLNTWGSFSAGDWVGVGIHSIAPVILICASEVAPIYRRKFRDLELTLNEQVTEVKVTKVVSRSQATGTRSSQVTNQVQSSSETSSRVQGSEVQSSQVQSSAEPTQTTVHSDGLTENQRAIRDGFMNGRKPKEVAEEIGLSSSYVSRQFKRIREELTTAA